MSFLDAKFELLLVLSQLISTVIIQESILKLSLGIKSFCFLIKALYINKFPLLVTEMLNLQNKLSNHFLFSEREFKTVADPDLELGRGEGRWFFVANAIQLFFHL